MSVGQAAGGVPQSRSEPAGTWEATHGYRTFSSSSSSASFQQTRQRVSEAGLLTASV